MHTLIENTRKAGMVKTLYIESAAGSRLTKLQEREQHKRVVCFFPGHAFRNPTTYAQLDGSTGQDYISRFRGEFKPSDQVRPLIIAISW